MQYIDLDLPLARRFSPAVDLPTVRVAQYTVAINLGGFIAVALLAGSLADSLRSAGARLEDASHRIRDLRAFNEYVINSLLSGLMTTDDRGRILTCNRAATTIIGLPANQVIGRDVVDLMQMSESVRERMAALTIGRSLKIDCQHRTPQGRVIDVGLTASTLAFPGGGTGYVWSFQDVTDVRRLERDARLPASATAGRSGGDGCRYRARDPESSRLDVGFDPGASSGTAVERGSGAVDGHRAA